MAPLELECGLEPFELPALRLLVDVGDGEVRIAARRLRSDRFMRFHLRLRHGGLLLRRALACADRLDLDLRQRGAKACLAAVASLRASLADANLVAADVADDLRGHLDARGEVAVAVAAREE